MILQLNQKRVIIEFNGVAFHPKSPNDKWIHPFTKESAQLKYDSDCAKETVAVNSGFSVITIWSDKSPQENLIHIKQTYERITNNIR